MKPHLYIEDLAQLIHDLKNSNKEASGKARRKRIHVNRQTLARNHKMGEEEPPIGIEEVGRKKRYAHHGKINGPRLVRYSEEKPLSCGARVWIETYASLTTIPPEEDV